MTDTWVGMALVLGGIGGVVCIVSSEVEGRNSGRKEGYEIYTL